MNPCREQTKWLPKEKSKTTKSKEGTLFMSIKYPCHLFVLWGVDPSRLKVCFIFTIIQLFLSKITQRTAFLLRTKPTNCTLMNEMAVWAIELAAHPHHFFSSKKFIGKQSPFFNQLPIYWTPEIFRKPIHRHEWIKFISKSFLIGLEQNRGYSRAAVFSLILETFLVLVPFTRCFTFYYILSFSLEALYWVKYCQYRTFFQYQFVTVMIY